MLFFFYGNKGHQKVRNTSGEPIHKAKDISHTLGSECSLSAQYQYIPFSLTVIENVQFIKDLGGKIIKQKG